MFKQIGSPSSHALRTHAVVCLTRLACHLRPQTLRVCLPLYRDSEARFEIDQWCSTPYNQLLTTSCNAPFGLQTCEMFTNEPTLQPPLTSSQAVCHTMDAWFVPTESCLSPGLQVLVPKRRARGSRCKMTQSTEEQCHYEPNLHLQLASTCGMRHISPHLTILPIHHCCTTLLCVGLKLTLSTHQMAASEYTLAAPGNMPQGKNMGTCRP